MQFVHEKSVQERKKKSVVHVKSMIDTKNEFWLVQMFS